MLEEFLTSEEEQQIVQAIQKAEQVTSGEIRVHLEEVALTKSTKERALEVFSTLKMHETAAQNGILIYIHVAKKEFQIIGDKGIHDHVGNAFWEHSAQLLSVSFEKQEYTNGLCELISFVGEALKTYFPYDHVNDKNELPDEISKHAE